MGGGCWGGWGRIALGGFPGAGRNHIHIYLSLYIYIYKIMMAWTEYARFQPFGCGQKKQHARTRMLTRMLMVQMSKHMDMQSRRTLFCNSLFEQSCTYFSCYQSAVWSGKCRVWSVECKVRSVECKVWSGEFRVCKVWSVECRVTSVECKV